MTQLPMKTDLEVIRDALAVAERTSKTAAARQFGVSHRTIGRWQARRARLGGQWPTDTDIAEWKADAAANTVKRTRLAQQAHAYRKAVYLNGGRPLQMPSLGTTRRLQALFALGWTTRDLARELDVTSARVGHLMNGNWARVWPSTAAAVAEVYEQLCMSVPADPTPVHRGEVRVHERARREAARRGYPPPLAWDDIDGLHEQPVAAPLKQHRRRADIDEAVVLRILDGDILPCTIAERREVTRRWIAAGRSTKELTAFTGWKVERYGKVHDLTTVAS